MAIVVDAEARADERRHYRHNAPRARSGVTKTEP
jgi:hypothetical protein